MPVRVINEENFDISFLEVGCVIRKGTRNGKATEMRDNGVVVDWEEWTHPLTCAVLDAGPALYKKEVIHQDHLYGQLEVISRPMSFVRSRSITEVQRDERNHIEIERMLVRKACVLASEELIAEGEMRGTRAEHERNSLLLVHRAHIIHVRIAEEAQGGNRPHPILSSSSKALYGSQTMLEPYKFSLKGANAKRTRDETKLGASIYKWVAMYRDEGEEGLYDDYRNCGANSGHTDELRDFVTKVLMELEDQERQSPENLRDSVNAAILKENLDRQAQGPNEKLLPLRVSKDFVQTQRVLLGYVNRGIRNRGYDVAYRDMHAGGLGILTSRALERVEIDEYTIDLQLLMKISGAFDYLSPKEAKAMGLDGTAQRVKISAAIDVHTRCLLALLVVPEGTVNSLALTLEMVYSDKSDISDAMGCTYKWLEYGAPELIAVDRGAAYITDPAYHILNSLGITNMGGPAGKPWLKPFIERVFRTMHEKLLARFSGRTFGDAVKRGENDSQGRATLELAEFLKWMVRWAVDDYHNTRHNALGTTPREAWQEATRYKRPRTLTNKEMRQAFGEIVQRRLGPSGLVIDNIKYQSDKLIDIWKSEGHQLIETRRWSGNIGTIDIRKVSDNGKGKWETAVVCDPDWLEKTAFDVRVWNEGRRKINPEAEQTRLLEIWQRDQRSWELKAQSKLFAQPRSATTGKEMTDEHIDTYTDTAERRYAKAKLGIFWLMSWRAMPPLRHPVAKPSPTPRQTPISSTTTASWSDLGARHENAAPRGRRSCFRS
ncbi:DDE-type integrase/transposase/recombinase [Tropicibacter naphthalenivorans]|uniref:Integrase core domain protein n=1 Tax=Tropicibacter naphthalenivorans TaxID=441103 RepID=A0A0P1FZR9_9RHOB|nr:DDE-type integrase/transposase/recombinase [Tropicibacter naphthalenivorans]CUH74653.1 Integrase core domain protein [Tropicibacter naphthalenivorans]SMC50045.1 Integrase core domain-containing protein [Tropicibacter naphthalenivorans]